MAIATKGCNVTGRHNFLAQKVEAKIVSLVSVHSHAHRFTSVYYYTAVDLYRNCESTLMQLWMCFTVWPFRPACLAMHQTTMKTKGRQLQRACKTRWLSSEAIVRATSEILAFGAALKQLSGNKNDATCVALLRLIKTKNFNMVLSFSQHCHQLTWQNWAKFFRRYVLTLRRWKLP